MKNIKEQKLGAERVKGANQKYYFYHYLKTENHVLWIWIYNDNIHKIYETKYIVY